MYLEQHTKGWRCHVQKNGQRASAVWATKREAQDWGRRKELEFMADKPGGSHTFGQATAKYAAEVSSKKEGERWDLLRLDAFLAHFGDVPLDSINQPEIGAWRMALDDPLSIQRRGNAARERA